MPLKFQEIPGWISLDNDGANIAAADLDEDGQPELLVLRVDRPGNAPNRGFYRVGKGLDAARNTATWGPWIEIPDWTANQNLGAGIAVPDFGAEGLALVVFQVQHVDPGPNKG